MPIYEYRCRECGKASSQFLRSFSQEKAHTCPHCESGNVVRLISRVAVLKPLLGGSMDWLPSYETMSDVDENDPKSVASWMKRMRQEAGYDGFGSEMADMNSLMDAGVRPEDLDADDSDT